MSFNTKKIKCKKKVVAAASYGRSNFDVGRSSMHYVVHFEFCNVAAPAPCFIVVYSKSKMCKVSSKTATPLQKSKVFFPNKIS